MKKVHPLLQVIFFPLTAYLFICTTLLFSLFKFEIGIKGVGNKTKSKFFRYEFLPTEYHKKSFWFTITAIITFWFILLYDIILFIIACVIYFWEYIIEVVELLYEGVIKQVQLIWEQISNMFK